MSNATRNALQSIRTLHTTSSDESYNAMEDIRRMLRAPLPICMECGHETREVYPLCHDCAEVL